MRHFTRSWLNDRLSDRYRDPGHSPRPDREIRRYRWHQDPGLLEAALFRPQTGYYADLIDEAAALWESLAQNHPFLDGNKRVAFAATYTFLAINGTWIAADADEAFDFINGLHQSGTFEFKRLAAWLRTNTIQQPQ